MNCSLYINGVYEDVLEEIRKAQAAEPGLICYLQPYASQLALEQHIYAYDAKLMQHYPSAAG